MFKFIVLTLFLSLNVIAEEKLRFRFYNSYSKATLVKKNKIIAVDNEESLKNDIEDLAINFDNHLERKESIADLCSNKSIEEKVIMARHLSKLTSEIYDYSKADSKKVTEAVEPKDQWNAISLFLNNDSSVVESSGICRDMSRTVSDFLISCGVPKSCIEIQSYRSTSGGHQVVQIGCNEEIYTINWSELYTTDNQEVINIDLNPNIFNTGLQVTTYDPETGEVIDSKQTELGHIMSSVVGGKTNDPFYIPQVIMLEAQYSILTLGAFKSTLLRGDELAGIKAVLEKSPFQWMHLKAGLSYARNSIEPNGELVNSTIDQDIFYYSIDGAVDIPTIELFEIDNRHIELSNSLYFYGAGQNVKTKIDSKLGEEFAKSAWNHDGYFFFGHESTLSYENKSSHIYASYQKEYGVNSKKYNTEITHQKDLGQTFAIYKREDTFRFGISKRYLEHSLGSEVSHRNTTFGDIYSVNIKYGYGDSFVASVGASKLKEFWEKESRDQYQFSLSKKYSISSHGILEVSFGGVYSPSLVGELRSTLNVEYIPN